MRCASATFNRSDRYPNYSHIEGWHEYLIFKKNSSQAASRVGITAEFGSAARCYGRGDAIEDRGDRHSPPPKYAATQAHPPAVHSSMNHRREYRRIDQPLSHNVIVSVGGLALMLAELWWFLLSQPQARPLVTSAPPPDNATADKDHP